MVIDDFPLIGIANKISCEVVVDSNRVAGEYVPRFGALSPTIILREYNPFVWFHELGHAIDFYLGAKMEEGRGAIYSLDDYLQLPTEIVANGIAVSLCKEYGFEIESQYEPQTKYKANQTLKRRIKKALKFVKENQC
jgi:hypothetical protein